MRRAKTASGNGGAGDNILAILKRKGLDQKDLAERMDVSDGYVSRIVNGHRVLSVDLTVRVAEALEVEPSEIDPLCTATALAALRSTEVRSLGQTAAIYTLAENIGKITDKTDLAALTTIIKAFADRASA